MSALNLILLAVALTAGTLASAALLSSRALRRDISSLRADLAAVPAPRPAFVAPSSAEEIRNAVADALADEREREMAEARAFWAEQEARESAGGGGSGGGTVSAGCGTGLGTDFDAEFGADFASDLGTELGTDFRAAYGTGHGADSGAEFDVPPVLPYLPRQSDFAGVEPDVTVPQAGSVPHPSGPDFTPSPVVAGQDQTAARLSDLADGRVPLADVRPGPLGTLDVYVFADGTTLCMTPGHRETADELCDALDDGETPYLLGGSAVGGAYALTFAYGERSVYILVDRIVASL